MVDRRLQESGLPPLGEEDFEQSDHQALAHLVLSALEQDEMEAMHYVQEQIPETLRPLLDELLKPLAKGEPTAERLLEDLCRSIMRLRLLRITEALNQLRHLQQEIQEPGDLKNSGYPELVMQYTQMRDRLDRALRQPGGM